SPASANCSRKRLSWSSRPVKACCCRCRRASCMDRFWGWVTRASWMWGYYSGEGGRRVPFRRSNEQGRPQQLQRFPARQLWVIGLVVVVPQTFVASRLFTTTARLAPLPGGPEHLRQRFGRPQHVARAAGHVVIEHQR